MFSLTKSFDQIKEFMQSAGMVDDVEDSNSNDKPTLDEDGDEIKDETQIAKEAREAKTEKNRIQKARKRETKKLKKQGIVYDEEAVKRGVIMLKNFPHGFYEAEQMKFFSQFGEVTRLKIARSRKTGKAKNYGFIEFKFCHVAKIAAESMNNYLMFDKIMKCEYLPEDKVHPELFKHWNKPFVTSVKLHKDQHNAAKSDAQEYRLLKKRLARLQKQKEKLQAIGVDFECCVVNRPKELEQTKKKDLSKSPRIPTNKFENVPLKTVKLMSKKKSLATKGIRQRIPTSALRLPKFARLYSAWNSRKSS